MGRVHIGANGRQTVGVATNTAQRALRLLRDAGLVEHSQQHRVGSGRFDAAIYRLDIPTDVLSTKQVRVASVEQPFRSEPKGPPVSKPAPLVGQQLVLLPS